MGSYKENMDVVKKFLDENDWHYDMHDHGHVATFTGGVGGFKGLYNSFRFILFVGEDEVQNYATFPASAKDKLPEMAEFITRANYGLKYGDFEMDWNDGEVRFHLTFSMSAVRADEMILPTLLLAPPRMLDQYSKGFTEVLMGLKTPADAIKDCEGD
ncbi:MAG: YbjN domain-containing protein [Kiritimatiellae bacterium]|nr:YbjN domain-containing protein [Kiritimatiellia bacterium]MBQ3344214.1 YbjN domain-containing protein [Kiritimatiellia bacterium]